MNIKLTQEEIELAIQEYIEKNLSIKYGDDMIVYMETHISFKKLPKDFAKLKTIHLEATETTAEVYLEFYNPKS